MAFLRNRAPRYRKVGGLHFIAWGRMRLSFCLTSKAGEHG